MDVCLNTELSTTEFAPSQYDVISHFLKIVKKDVQQYLVQNAPEGWWTQLQPVLDKALQYNSSAKLSNAPVLVEKTQAAIHLLKSVGWKAMKKSKKNNKKKPTSNQSAAARLFLLFFFLDFFKTFQPTDKQCLAAAQSRMASLADRRRKDVQFEPEDYVYVRNKKFTP